MAKPVLRTDITSEWSPKNREGVGGQGARRNMEGGGGKLPGNLIHVRNHEQQTLGRGEGSGQRSGLERAMDGAGGAAFTLHLHHVGTVPQMFEIC